MYLIYVMFEILYENLSSIFIIIMCQRIKTKSVYLITKIWCITLYIEMKKLMYLGSCIWIYISSIYRLSLNYKYIYICMYRWNRTYQFGYTMYIVVVMAVVVGLGGGTVVGGCVAEIYRNNEIIDFYIIYRVIRWLYECESQ